MVVRETCLRYDWVQLLAASRQWSDGFVFISVAECNIAFVMVFVSAGRKEAYEVE